MCELTHGMAEERHGRGMLCVNRPLGCVLILTPPRLGFETGSFHQVSSSRPTRAAVSAHVKFPDLITEK